jgi:hypothetical protein
MGWALGVFFGLTPFSKSTGLLVDRWARDVRSVLFGILGVSPWR